ncbi:Regulation of carbohydrate metabolism-like protein [Ceratobasidium theobromae]|uniref:Regulation of carbohydrate metabolism-like protein n=1 Tax=Ceratobasidium theobromae TaxID=1582974 RepID=A0A5N5QH83_9AGAM|nr:Regulation of carbohydrate metabolism-like protein [Ceratobasidium theobromae]
MAQYIPGSSVTLSASISALAQQPPADDAHVVSNLPQICVDYLSHDWQEEDVWKSWRNMTRHKHEIANGVRLENASWRTWWKQRNKLRTVSPETLNWLKDSDVTWLYGPLHTAEPVPPHKESSLTDKLDLIKAAGKKPILKHRTLSELLLLPRPSSPILEASDFIDDEPLEYDHDGNLRPPLPHTKSDTNIIRRPTRRISPPRVVVGMGAIHPDAPSLQVNGLQKTRSRGSDSSNSPRGGGSDLDSNSGKERRHIHFNTFVEQCISIEKPRSPHGDDDSDADETEDDILEIRSISGSSTTSVLSHHSRPSFLRRDSNDKDLISIAPIAPTILKSSDPHPAPSPAVVFVPPIGSFYEGEHHVLQYHALQQNNEGYAPPIPVNILDYASPSPASSSSSSQSHWEDEDEDYGVGFDYFRGPDLGVGQEYDTIGSIRASSYVARGAQRPRQSSSPVPSEVSTTPTQGDLGANMASPKDRDDEHATSSNSSTDTTVQPPPANRSPSLPNGRVRSSPSASQSPSTRSPPRPGRSILKNADAGGGIPIAYRGSYDTPQDSAYLSPSDLRGRSLSPGGEERGRSNVRTPPAIEERERSSSRGTSSPIGSVSPNSSRPGSALGRRRAERGAVTGEEVARTVPIGVVANAIVSSSGACSNGRKPKFAQGTARPSLVIQHSPVSKEEGTSGSVEEGISGAELERRRDDFWADSTDFVPPPPVVQPSSAPRKAADDQAHAQDEIDGDGSLYTYTKGANAPANKTPANSPVLLRSQPLPSKGDMASQLPHVSTPLPPSPPHPTASIRLGAQAKPGEHQEDGTLVGRAVDMVHSAKGLLGAIWNGRGPVPAEQ